MALITYYNTGTASVVAAATLVNFFSAGLGSADFPTIMPGDLFSDPGQPEIPPQRIASVDYAAQTATLWEGWPGATIAAAPYEIRFAGDVIRSTAQTRRYLELLGQLGPLGIQPDAFGNFTDRATYDDEDKGFVFASLDGSGGQDNAIIYIKASSTSGDWTSGLSVTGPEGPGGNFVALSDEVTIITTGKKLTMRHYGITSIQDIRAGLNVASSSGVVTIDIKKNGSSIFITKLTIDQGELTSKTAATPYSLVSAALGDDDELTFHVDGAGTGAIGLKVLIKEQSV